MNAYPRSPLGSVPSWIRRHVVTETGDRLMGLGRG